MKIAIVTGASSGMGSEMVTQLADRFAGIGEIWVIARRMDRLLAFEGTVPVRVRPFALDLADPENLDVLRETLNKENPNVKILVNAAGYGKTGTAGSMDESQSLGMIRLNDEALTAVTEMVLPYISENSRIIQFASAAAFLPQPGFAVYAASKSYVLSYSRALSAELRPKNIVVTAVCPGPVSTEFFDIALEGKPLSFYKKLVMVKPDFVVRTAIRDSLMGKEVSIAGPVMKLFFVLCRILPHRLIMKFITW